MATNNAINLKSSGIASYDGAGAFTALANPLTVSNGGTGISSDTAYAILCGGTTSTGAIQSIAGLGSSGQVLTSNGAGALPTFQAASGASKLMFMLRTTSSAVADATSYYLGPSSATNFTDATDACVRFFAPFSCTVTSVYGAVFGTTGSNESSTFYIRKNNTTDTTITNSFSFTASPTTFSNTGLSVSLSAGDYITLKWTTPTWATNPSSVTITATIVCT